VGVALKVAVTDLAALMVTAQVLSVPEQAPPQPLKTVPNGGTLAVSVTGVPLIKESEQVVGQLIPAGLLVTMPLPSPLTVTDSGYMTLKLALTDLAAFIVTLQVPVPEQAPPQPVKLPVLALAVSVTTVPLLKLEEQVEPQLIPAGALVTLPLPLPFLETVRRYGTGAVTFRLAVAGSPLPALVVVTGWLVLT
jgi:hypothetical protein